MQNHMKKSATEYNFIFIDALSKLYNSINDWWLWTSVLIHASQALICSLVILNHEECVHWSILPPMVLHDLNSPNFGCYRAIIWTWKASPLTRENWSSFSAKIARGRGWNHFQITRITGINFLPGDPSLSHSIVPDSTLIKCFYYYYMQWN